MPVSFFLQTPRDLVNRSVYTRREWHQEWMLHAGPPTESSHPRSWPGYQQSGGHYQVLKLTIAEEILVPVVAPCGEEGANSATSSAAPLP